MSPRASGRVFVRSFYMGGCIHSDSISSSLEERKSRSRNTRERRISLERTVLRTDCVIQVPVPEIVDGAPRPAHDQRAGAEEKDVL